MSTIVPCVACAVLLLLVGTDVLPTVLGERNVSLVAALKLGCYLGILLLCLAYHRATVAGALHAPALVLLLALTAASLLWSVDPNETLHRLIALVACSALGALIGEALSLRSFVIFVAAFGIAVAALSLLAIGTIPAARGAPPWDDVWRGIFNHKNGLGGACAILLPFTAHAAIVSAGRLRHVFALGAVLCLVLLAASFSRTAQLIAAIALVNLAFGLLLRNRQLTWIVVTVAILLSSGSVVALLFATGLTDVIFEAIGRKPTMSGRIPIWRLVWPWIEARPLLGYGYAAFWDPDSRRVMEIARDPAVNFAPYYSHNGMLESLLAVGAVGFGLLLWIYVQMIRALIVIASRMSDANLAPLLVFLVSFVMLNVSESSTLARDDLVWVLFVAIAVRLGALVRTLRHLDRAAAAGPSLRRPPQPLARSRS